MEPIYLAPLVIPVLGLLMAAAGMDLTDPKHAEELRRERENNGR